ncbi:hypothetical protein RA307_15725 [Xanthobacteraceae bacterium Astr-EGSB]|uniref:hypothetical protein n=1 Tax=Astrobacterium formosum TaxID=3069710 RepID=UPI0027B7ABE7|nr:hypothetical protein [Xanthobacteraceae bacterium Astr-EGSB]
MKEELAVFAPDPLLPLVKTTNTSQAPDPSMSSPQPPDSIEALADTLRREHGVTVNTQQRRRLAWLAARLGTPFVWTGLRPAPEECRLLVVVEPPGRLQLERLDQTLAQDGALVIPCGEDSAYDALKSRLSGFGIVGADGTEGPHQLWWGGHAGRNAKCTIHNAEAPAAMSLREPGTDHGKSRAERLLTLWQACTQAVVWRTQATGGDASVARPLEFDCDFAVRRRTDWQLSPHTLYFGRRPAAEALLLTWTKFCRAFRTVDDMQLLDQAWCLVTSQTALDTLWLPEVDQPVAIQSVKGFAGECVMAVPEWSRPVRPAERTGPPELSMPGVTTTGRCAMAIVRDSQSRGSRALASTVEALAHAFAADPADFCQLEVVLCTTRDDLHAAFSAASVDSVLVVTPAHVVTADIFRKLADESRLCAVVSPPLQVFDLAQSRALRRRAIVRPRADHEDTTGASVSDR